MNLKGRYSKCFIVLRLITARWMISTCYLTAVFSSATSALGESPSLCLDALSLDLHQSREIRHHPGQSYQTWWLNIASAGILQLEIFPSAAGPAAPRIELLGPSCSAPESGDLIHVERAPGRALVKVNQPGGYYVAVRTTPDMPQGNFLRVSLSEGRALTIGASDSLSECVPLAQFGLPPAKTHQQCDDGGDDGDSIRFPDPPPVSSFAPKVAAVQAIATAAKEDLTVTVGQPGVLEITSAGVLMKVDRGEVHLGFSSVADLLMPEAFRFYPICDLPGADDHGDGFTCATVIEPGFRARGEIQGLPASDRDVFTFALSRRGTLILETVGETHTRGRLFDATGFLLAAGDDGGEATNFRMIESLDPGRYYLSVEAAAPGPYLLVTSFADDGGGRRVRP